MATLGVHLVGSLPSPLVPSPKQSFTLSATSFPNRLLRIPDGEPGPRSGWIAFQAHIFPKEMLKQYDSTFTPIPLPAIPEASARAAVAALPPLKPGYAAAALESWTAFRALKDAGIIPSYTRFMISIPTPVAVMCFLRPEYQPLVEPLYEAALLAELRELEAQIPKSELAIQWDFAVEIVTIEGFRGMHFAPYFEPYELVGSVDQEVQVGTHLCYGDIGNKHSIEPKDTGLLVRVAYAVVQKAGRRVDWVHLPVPKERDDDAYFAPLKGLEIGDTELYLGLVHGYDEEGTMRRIEAAKKAVKRFGVATECGMGRTPQEKFDSIAEICTKVSQPVTRKDSKGGL
ncbi:Hypothetical protein D9617_26g079330 [Elsinoe fawcettii]|nr:Hypothetical protein D9617_26g079330 [Elsinoe fawcettii]